MRFEAGRVLVSFDHAQSPGARDDQVLNWFEIAGADGRFHPASAALKGSEVVVNSPAVPEPRSVRFAWHEAAQPNLVNRAGLPAVPFRSAHPIPSNPLSR